MLSLDKQLAAVTPPLPHEKDAFRRQIAGTDRRIDAVVYELYGLTEEEAGIVEGE